MNFDVSATNLRPTFLRFLTLTGRSTGEQGSALLREKMLQLSWKRGTQSSVNNPESWQILESATLFKNPHIEVLRERVIPPGEIKPRDWTVTRRKKAVVIAPV